MLYHVLWVWRPPCGLTCLGSPLLLLLVDVKLELPPAHAPLTGCCENATLPCDAARASARAFDRGLLLFSEKRKRTGATEHCMMSSVKCLSSGATRLLI